MAGGPPPKASQAGGLKFPAELDLNGFFRKTVTIHAGDSVKWVWSKRVVHTVTFLAKGDSRPPLERPDPANPYTGYNDSQGSAVLVQRAAEHPDPAPERVPAGRLLG